ncbi:MAG TPA: adenylate/guanylate cyclase domain-containing protein [Oligoflexia bacterium]|nr:adenylate/guanylate cyclase domain-containing protein [Oligoflexia bacterium]HMP49209.1 adenylate/guanylate cyclase domain-containing protein [Oligoflexia bacterium]
MNKSAGFLTILSIVWTLGLVLFWIPNELTDGLEFKVWDFRVSLVANPNKADKRIKIIDINQDTLDFFDKEYGLTWPFPRQIYTHVISYLTHAGAKGLAFDILFTESSVQGVEMDNEFAKSTGGSLPVVSAVILRKGNAEISSEKLQLFTKRQEENINLNQITDKDKARSYSSITLPIPELLEHSTAFGNVQAEPDSDGIFRRISPVGYISEIPVLSLPFSLYNIAEGSDKNNFSRINIPTEDKIVRLHGGSSAYQTYSLEDIAHSSMAIAEGKDPLIDPDIFKGSLVLLGANAPGLLDLRPTSIDEKLGGVYLNAAALDNILNSDFIKRPGFLEIQLINFFLITLTLVATLHGPKISNHILRVITIIILFSGLSLYLASAGYWLPVVIPVFCCMVSAFLGVSLQYNLEGRQHRFIRSAFKFYVSPAVVEKIVAAPESLTLGGDKRELSIFFSDIVGFTSISEQLDPGVLVRMLNEYLSLFTQIIQSSGGTVDKFVGDAVMAFWNAPLDQADHGERALKAAIACQEALKLARSDFKSRFGVFPDTRIGINTDLVSVGNFGSHERFNYTAIGDGVNLASRLEGANKNFGTRVLMTETTRAKLPQTARSRFVADLVVVGKSLPITVFEPLYGQSYDQSQNLLKYEKAIFHLKNNELELARKLFLQIPDDPLANAYLKKLGSTNNNDTDLLKWNLKDK